MNCIDFRREVLAQPLRLAPQAREHAAECPACRAFIERQRDQEAALFEALRVPVPEGLPDRILLASGIRRRRAPWIWAMAASLVAAAGLALLVPALSGRSLADEAIEHVLHEPQSFRVATSHPQALLPTRLASQGVRLASALGEVTYAVLCPTAAGKAHHLVVATAAGPVTLLLLPADDTPRRRALVESDGMTAIALPAARGSIAIVAPTRALALDVERALSFT